VFCLPTVQIPLPLPPTARSCRSTTVPFPPVRYVFCHTVVFCYRYHRYVPAVFVCVPTYHTAPLHRTIQLPFIYRSVILSRSFKLLRGISFDYPFLPRYTTLRFTVTRYHSYRILFDTCLYSFTCRAVTCSLLGFLPLTVTFTVPSTQVRYPYTIFVPISFHVVYSRSFAGYHWVSLVVYCIRHRYWRAPILYRSFWFVLPFSVFVSLPAITVNTSFSVPLPYRTYRLHHFVYTLPMHTTAALPAAPPARIFRSTLPPHRMALRLPPAAFVCTVVSAVTVTVLLIHLARSGTTLPYLVIRPAFTGLGRYRCSPAFLGYHSITVSFGSFDASLPADHVHGTPPAFSHLLPTDFVSLPFRRTTCHTLHLVPYCSTPSTFYIYRLRLDYRFLHTTTSHSCWFTVHHHLGTTPATIYHSTIPISVSGYHLPTVLRPSVL